MRHGFGPKGPKLLILWAVLALTGAVVTGLTGCEDASRRPVAYHPPSNLSPSSKNVLLVDQEFALEPSRGRFVGFLTPAPDGIALLTDQLQAHYERGDREFKAGRRAGAIQEFRRAQDLLVRSGFDPQSDIRLATLNDWIVEALAQSGPVATASAQQVEKSEKSEEPDTALAPPAPLDEISEIAIEPDENSAAILDPKLRSSAEGELQEVPSNLPLTVNEAVLSYLNFFQTSRGRAIVETGLRRAGHYRPMIEQVLRQEGLPTDLIYMAQAESAFQPQALSRAGARGLWQFMSFRGKEYGLEHSRWVDDRQDPEKATHAAARHLRDLYNMFGDWYLAMAAYNSGPGAVEHAVERTGYADFWQLYRLNVLPKETRNYVPIILAMTLIAKDPARYGISVQPDEPIRVDDIQPGHSLSLRLLAESMDVDIDTLRLLNPQLLHLTTPEDPAFILHVPAGTAQHFAAGMAPIPPNKWLSWRQHRVQEGETLTQIAQKYRVTAASIVDVNNLAENPAEGGLATRASLDIGAKLIIPVTDQPQAGVGKLVRYRVRRNDTLASVADEFDVSLAELKSWNHLRGNTVASGTRLKIYPGGMPPSNQKSAVTTQKATKPSLRAATTTPTPAAGQKVVYRVQPGETLYSIARANKTSVESLRAANSFLFSRPLQAGDLLTILSLR